MLSLRKSEGRKRMRNPRNTLQVIGESRRWDFVFGYDSCHAPNAGGPSQRGVRSPQEGKRLGGGRPRITKVCGVGGSAKMEA